MLPAEIIELLLREALSAEARHQEATRRILEGAGLLETMQSLGRA